MCMFSFCSLPEVFFSPNAARLLTAYSTFALFLAMFRELFSFRWSDFFPNIYASAQCSFLIINSVEALMFVISKTCHWDSLFLPDFHAFQWNNISSCWSKNILYKLIYRMHAAAWPRSNFSLFTLWSNRYQRSRLSSIRLSILERPVLNLLFVARFSLSLR